MVSYSLLVQFEDFLIDFDATNFANEQQKKEIANLTAQVATSEMHRKIIKDYIKLCIQLNGDQLPTQEPTPAE